MHVARSSAQAQHRRLSGLQAVLCMRACGGRQSTKDEVELARHLVCADYTAPKWHRSRSARVCGAYVKWQRSSASYVHVV